MKKLLLLIAFVASGWALSTANAQVRVNINIGAQPAWGPSGYDYADYYYLPDLDVYYNVPNRMWTYYDGGRWCSAGYLPGYYNRYDLYNCYKVVINERNPWLRNSYYSNRYRQYRGYHGQPVLRDRGGYYGGSYGNRPYGNNGGNYGRDGRNDRNWGYSNNGRGGRPDNNGWNDRGGNRNDRSDGGRGGRNDAGNGQRSGRNEENGLGRGNQNGGGRPDGGRQYNGQSPRENHVEGQNGGQRGFGRR